MEDVQNKAKTEAEAKEGMSTVRSLQYTVKAICDYKLPTGGNKFQSKVSPNR